MKNSTEIETVAKYFLAEQLDQKLKRRIQQMAKTLPTDEMADILAQGMGLAAAIEQRMGVC